jgi:SAM-dependent methyltransferase
MSASVPAQDQAAVEKNKSFFAGNDRYAERVAALTTYKNIRNAVNERIVGIQRLLDVGNGGVFDYDTSLVPEVVGVDLFLDDSKPERAPPNVTLRVGNALALGEPEAAYDGVLMVSVLHHLVGSDIRGTVANIRRAVAEMRRVMMPDGRLVVVESCISSRAYAVERRLFGALCRISARGLMEHPPALQLPAKTIEQLLAEQFSDVRVEQIPVGLLILQFGHLWPTALTPARPFVFTGRSD